REREKISTQYEHNTNKQIKTGIGSAVKKKEDFRVRAKRIESWNRKLLDNAQKNVPRLYEHFGMNEIDVVSVNRDKDLHTQCLRKCEKHFSSACNFIASAKVPCITDETITRKTAKTEIHNALRSVQL
ncbi:hypothetical protein RFI_33264, partial [Reticulomyxa filosa]